MDVGWLASQLVIGLVVVVLVVGGLAFFALVEPRHAGPTEAAGVAPVTRGRTDGRSDEAGAADGQAAGSHPAGEPATGEQPNTGQPASGHPTGGEPTADPTAGGPTAASVFETEPCWLSLLRGGRASADGGDAPIAFVGGPDGVSRPG
jgi:hypothetical protein